MQVLVPAHSLSGSVPGAIAPHEPLEPPPFFAALHAWQSPEQGLLQQNPSTQLPLAHWEAAVHAVPFVATHAPALQYALSPGHSSSGSIPVKTGPQVPFAMTCVLVTLHA